MGIILVIDVGTSSMRGVLYSKSGEVHKIIQEIYSPEYLINNKVEQDPFTFKEALVNIVKQSVDIVKALSDEIIGISLTSQRSSMIALDSEYNPLRKAIMWQDRRTLEICSNLSQHENYIYERTGLKLSPVFLAPKIAWLKQNEEEIYIKSFKIVTIADYLMCIMTNELRTDYTYGSRTLLMNLHTLKWDADLLNLFDIDEDKLCTLGGQGSIVGYTTDDFSKLSGLKTGIPVISAGGDQQCSAMGNGVINEGDTQVTTGTGSFVITSSDKIHIDPVSKVICSVSAVPNKYILEASILTSGTIYNWFNNNFYCSDETAEYNYDKINFDAESSEPGSNGIILLPYFQGSGSPNWNPNATGLFHGVSLGTRRGDFSRSILEGIAAEIGENLDILRSYVGKIARINISGGLTKNPLFNQIQADMYGESVNLPSDFETTALGAFASAAVALGLHKSITEALECSNKYKENTVYKPILNNIEIYYNIKIRRKAVYNDLYNGNNQLNYSDSKKVSIVR
ncbi:xylulokinase/glycerol kinase [Clostridium saccharoperbutylacetonicum]|uniref:Glycerol kinase 2 n=1 Tax=Clostridium saccharoperbutylacetonicum N1-4(HMT) TaxID=931276 RepID=M1MXB4_9CLOT|nr:FGGY-family carbohydrate kinase [Clostridium saccharoperbutylacetonicum]AGF56102.1 glycerol kinase 2 [Clostridium saccharoperbutylacetonicum N1-4(HMT)]NRT63158.1 xylulokinase/glycerol kinase [Clostridium saccharoperbutylacetonicum]NSB26518.1 xylulokinase/glycerol kinase [Clostridium saccharoperbutylacetonicum]NSB45868.1 xylulokinase/glycerol kinase [Clostridium saccharoperbutylacetonicum]